ncbi:MAG: hypothetical protein P8R42_07530 [Candidatus Binatia bacterium]|nr:hypothetical protein [Candidatus Binatia bacterium]
MTALPRLYPSQVCFVVDDVAASATDCVECFGWGPFRDFTVRVEKAEYRGWRGRKVTDAVLGMAGRVQVELTHVHEVKDAVAAYQAEYGGIRVAFVDTPPGANARPLGALTRGERSTAGLRSSPVRPRVGRVVFYRRDAAARCVLRW